jgi:hypothetical protein
MSARGTLSEAWVRWAGPHLRRISEESATWMEWQASRDALGFYEHLGLVGDPCPDQEHPFFEITFAGPDALPIE